MQETQVQSLGWEDSLGKEMETHSSILARGNLLGKRAWQAIVHGVTRVGHDLETKATFRDKSNLETKANFIYMKSSMLTANQKSMTYTHTKRNPNK